MCIESIASLTNFSKEVDRFQVMDFCNRLIHFLLFFFFGVIANNCVLHFIFFVFVLMWYTFTLSFCRLHFTNCFNGFCDYTRNISCDIYIYIYIEPGKILFWKQKQIKNEECNFFRFKPRFWKKKMRFEIELDIISPASILHTIDQEIVWAHARLLMNFQARFYL